MNWMEHQETRQHHRAMIQHRTFVVEVDQRVLLVEDTAARSHMGTLVLHMAMDFHNFDKVGHPGHKGNHMLVEGNRKERHNLAVGTDHRMELEGNCNRWKNLCYTHHHRVLGCKVVVRVENRNYLQGHYHSKDEG